MTTPDPISIVLDAAMEGRMPTMRLASDFCTIGAMTSRALEKAGHPGPWKACDGPHDSVARLQGVCAATGVAFATGFFDHVAVMVEMRSAPPTTFVVDVQKRRVIDRLSGAGERLRSLEEIDQVKRNWAEDGSWDIEETEGFEPHVAELASFARRHERLARERSERLWEEKVSARMKAIGQMDLRSLAIQLIAADDRFKSIEERLDAME